MSTTTLTGILAAVVTPFTADGALDLDGIDRQVEHIIGNGVQGLVPGGSTGEFTTMTLDERRASNQRYVQAAAGRVPVIAGTGALSTADTVELTRAAKEDGADAVMIVPPFYGAPSYDELLAHYRAVSEAVDIPIMYYNLPDATGVELTPEQFAELGRTTNVTCFKDTGGDAPKFEEILLHHGDDITALNGWDTLTYNALALGAQAGVWGAASVVPAKARELWDVATSGDLVKARELWGPLYDLCVFLEAGNYPALIKKGVELVGVPAGPTRAPILPLDEETVEEFRGLLRALDVDVKA